MAAPRLAGARPREAGALAAPLEAAAWALKLAVDPFGCMPKAAAARALKLAVDPRGCVQKAAAATALRVLPRGEAGLGTAPQGKEAACPSHAKGALPDV